MRIGWKHVYVRFSYLADYYFFERLFIVGVYPRSILQGVDPEFIFCFDYSNSQTGSNANNVFCVWIIKQLLHCLVYCDLKASIFKKIFQKEIKLRKMQKMCVQISYFHQKNQSLILMLGGTRKVNFQVGISRVVGPEILGGTLDPPAYYVVQLNFVKKKGC